MSLKGRVALVTGGARGIGRGIALALGRAGADVAVNYLTSKKTAGDVVAALEEMGSRAVAIKADVTDPGEVQKLVDQVVEEFGRLDILINNVGDFLEKRLSDTSVEEFEAVLRSNLHSAFYGCQSAIPPMRRQGFGRIINIGLAGVTQVKGYRRIAPYAIAKLGLAVLTKSWAREVARQGVTINLISPGFIETESMPEGWKPEMIKTTPIGRLGTPQDVANVVLFLAQESAGYITGAEITVSGGFEV